MRASYRSLLFATATATATVLVSSCGSSSAPSPFGPPADNEGGSAGSSPLRPTGGSQPDAGSLDPTLGDSCQDDGQCDDGIDCTADECDAAVGRCRHRPDPLLCANDAFCDGVEQCDPMVGCVPGAAVSCSDDDTCTIDSCNESTDSCQHEPRDADGDGDPDGNCTGGGDCDDTDPFVSSEASEVCGNARDDDCDGLVDEAECTHSHYDVCADFLEIDDSGVFELPLAGAMADYAASCAGDGWRDVVVAFTTVEPTTIDVVATVDSGNLALATFDLCGDASTETSCQRAATGVPRGGTAGRTRIYQSEAGTSVLEVFGDRENTVSLRVQYEPFETPPQNETCSTAAPLPIGESFVTTVVGLDADLPTACAGAAGDALYELVTTTPVDLEVLAASTDGYGRPVLSLFSESCQSAQQEVTCRSADPVTLFARGLAPGTHYLGVAATGPSDIEVRAEVTPATDAPDDDDCVDPPLLEPGTATSLSFVDHADDVALDCQPGAVDAVYTLDLERASDVRLLQRLADDDQGAIALLPSTCDPEEALLCVSSARSPVRAALRDVPPGGYRVVAESQVGTPSEITALVRDAQPPTLVAFSDTCDEAIEIPEGGALLTGNTATASSDYSAGCDRGGVEGGGAPDQILQLRLESRKRVVLDMEDSGYQTLLDVRRGPSCPGEEVINGCSAGYVAGRSFLDLTLDPGDYWIQVDGYNGASGSWVLDAFVVDP